MYSISVSLLTGYHIPVAGKIGGNWIAKLMLVEFYFGCKLVLHPHKACDTNIN